MTRSDREHGPKILEDELTSDGKSLTEGPPNAEPKGVWRILVNSLVLTGVGITVALVVYSVT